MQIRTKGKVIIMLLDGKMKRIALLAAVDIHLRRGRISPKRCARNLIELGTSAYPEKLTQKEQIELYNNLIVAIADKDPAIIRSLFSNAFFNTHIS